MSRRILRRLSLPRERAYLRQTFRLVREAAGGWTTIWAGILVALGLLPLAVVYLARGLVDTLLPALQDGAPIGPLVTVAGLLVGAMAATELLRGVLEYVRAAQAERVRDHASLRIHQQCGRLDLSYYESPDYHDRLHRAAGEGGARAVSILEGSGSVIQNGITLVALAGALVPYGWWLPLALLVSASPSFAVLIRHNRRHHAWWERTTPERRWTQYFDRVLKSREAAPELRMLGIAPRFVDDYQQLRGGLRREQLALIRRQALGRLLARFCGFIVTIGILGWMGWRALEGEAGLGDLVLFQQVFTRGQSGMRAVMTDLSSVYRNILYVQNYFDFLDLEPRVGTALEPRPVPRPLEQGIRLREVTFRYPETTRSIVEGFDLWLPAGKTVAIVGANGAGKSTLIKLLLRLYDPEEGRVEWDGVDLRELDLDEVRRSVTVLFQTPIAYQGTAAENIAMGDISRPVDEERVRQAAVAAGADELIQRLPRGYDTHVGKIFRDGTDLSPGEYQRLALARAFYREADVIILDEPTSFMDSWAESRWLESFRRVAAGRTALVITHRFTTAMLADEIHVMEDGRVVETGDHASLVAADGPYARSWRDQTGTSSGEESPR